MPSIAQLIANPSSTPKRSPAGRAQRGEFLITRALWIVAILMVMLLVPVWWNKDTVDKRRKLEQKAAGAAQNSASMPPQARAAAAVEPAARPIGRGLSFAMATDAQQAPGTVQIACHGDPAPQDRPHQGSCNPYEGDTSCRTVLPVLCLKPGEEGEPQGMQAGFYKGWTGGTLAATQPVMGAILSSVALASARCEAEFGPDWRMAEFHDGKGGWGLQGVRAGGFNVGARYWVHVSDQPGNCWNSAP